MHTSPSLNSFGRTQRELVVRAGLARTFGSLVGFISLVLVCLGTYLIADSLTNPLEAQASALLAAAFVLGVAAILLYYLFVPSHKLRARGRHRHRSRRGTKEDSAEILICASKSPAANEQREFPFQ